MLNGGLHLPLAARLRQNGCPGRSDTGATLVELMVALAVVVAIVAMTIPALQRTQANLATERQADGAVQLLEAERLRAMRTNQVVVVSSALGQFSNYGESQLPTFTFRPDGSADGGRLRIGAGSQSRIIALDAVTSRPRINAAR